MFGKNGNDIVIDKTNNISAGLQVNSSPWSSRRQNQLVNSSPILKFNWSTRRLLSSPQIHSICVFEVWTTNQWSGWRDIFWNVIE